MVLAPVLAISVRGGQFYKVRWNAISIFLPPQRHLAENKMISIQSYVTQILQVWMHGIYAEHSAAAV